MKFRIGPIFAEFGRSQEQRNVIDIRNIEGNNCSVFIGLLAESFDSALSFYIRITEYLMSGTNSTVVELRGWNVRRLSSELKLKELKLKPEFLATNTLAYQDFPTKLIGEMFNTVWLACGIRILGFQKHAPSYRDVLASLEKNTLPNGIDFVIEKKSMGLSDFLSVRCDSQCSASLIKFLGDGTAGLKHPLVETRLPF
ncbi:MAG TPA: hypothetical protein VFA71_15140 [Terriglobales bacterium]|nr:hypothetical protein [Terriglobales bacterium]